MPIVPQPPSPQASWLRRAASSGARSSLAPSWRRLAAAAALAGSTLAVPVPSLATTPSATDAAIDQYLVQARDELGLPGVAVAIVRVGQSPHLVALGKADDHGRPVTAQTPFMLASLSKAFTATAIMQLVESGSVELDAPIETYLPWFALGGAPATGVTVRDLLAHTSGLTTRLGRAYHNNDDQDDGALERVVRGFVGAQQDAAPGELFAYSNANYDILGLIVQEVSGEPYDAYLAGHLFGPLGMRHTYATRDAARADGLADGYYRWFGTAWRPTDMPLPHGGVPSATTFSSVEDMATWVEVNLGAGGAAPAVLSPQSLATLHEPLVRIDDLHAYAMGWQVRPLWEAVDPMADPATDAYTLPRLVEHGGSWPNVHTYVGLVPSEGWGIAVLVNAGDETTNELFQVEQNVLRLMAGASPTASSPPVDLLVAARFPIAVGLLLLELVSLGISLRWLRSARRRPPGRPARVIAAAIAALALDGLVVWLVVGYLPDRFENDLPVLLRSTPDLSILILPTLGLALIWGPVRTILVAWTMVSPRTGWARARRGGSPEDAAS